MAKRKLKKKKSNKYTGFTQEEREELMDEFVELYGTNEYTMESVCSKLGFSMRSMRNWMENERIAKEENPDAKMPITSKFQQAKREAQFCYKEALVSKAKTSLERLVEGGKFDEQTTERRTNQQGQVVETKTKNVTKVILPNPTAVIFALKSQEPENFTETNKLELGLQNDISSVKFQIKKKGE